MSGGSAVDLAALIHEAVRTHAASAPPPRGLPYLGLEHASGTGLHLLDGLSTRGIFRKYELVLDLGAGLGGSSRWLAARLGCEVVATTTDAAEARAAAELTRRARLTAQVRALAAREASLPFRDGTFTHVWILEALPRLADPAAALAESHRVVRRGGTLAVQDLVVAGDGEATLVPGWDFACAAERIDALRAAGFVDIEVRERTAEAAERAVQVLAAREGLERSLRAAGPDLARVGREREALGRLLAAGRLRVVQLLARRA
jgi:SAM-dependent methyltransferase